MWLLLVFDLHISLIHVYHVPLTLASARSAAKENVNFFQESSSTSLRNELGASTICSASTPFVYIAGHLKLAAVSQWKELTYPNVTTSTRGCYLCNVLKGVSGYHVEGLKNNSSKSSHRKFQVGKRRNLSSTQ